MRFNCITEHINKNKIMGYSGVHAARKMCDFDGAHKNYSQAMP